MRKTLLLLAFCGCIMANAQQVTVAKNEPLLKGVVSNAYYPVLSDDGNTLLFTGSNFKGLKSYDFGDNVVTTITDAERAGMDAKVANDGTAYFTTQTTKDKLKFRNAQVYSPTNGKIVTIEENIREEVTPVLSKGVASYVSGEKIIKTTSTKKATQLVAFTQGSELVVMNNGVEKRFSPAGDTAGYLWASVSPSGQKVAFFAAGRGIFVTDINGKVLAKLGNYEMPQWYGNDYIVAQNAKDDGHQYVSSQLMLLKADGSFKTELTSPTSMSMQPSVAKDSHKIVYTTIDGRLFEMELTIAE